MWVCVRFGYSTSGFSVKLIFENANQRRNVWNNKSKRKLLINSMIKYGEKLKYFKTEIRLMTIWKTMNPLNKSTRRKRTISLVKEWNKGMWLHSSILMEKNIKHFTCIVNGTKKWSLLDALPLISDTRLLLRRCVYPCVNSLILSVKDDRSQFSGHDFYHTRLCQLTVQVQKMN